MDPILDRFEAEIADVRYAEPQIPLVSNLSGRFGSLALIGEPGYWRRHLREPVRFAAAMQQLADRGVTHFIEMSPHPVLLAMASEVVPDGTFIASLRQGSDDATSVAEAIQQLYCAGVDFDWLAVHRDGGPRRHRALPTYPFQRKRHWIDAAMAPPRREAPEADPWSRLERVLSRESERAPIDVDVASYPAKWQCLERLSLAVAVGVLLDSGLFSRRGERLDLDGVMTHGRLRVDLSPSRAALARTARGLGSPRCRRWWLDCRRAAGPAGSRGGVPRGRRTVRRQPAAAGLRPTLRRARRPGPSRRGEPAGDAVPRRCVRPGAGSLRALGDDALHQPAGRGRTGRR